MGELFKQMDLTIWLWLAAIVLFGAVEAVTAGLVCIWFVAGAVAALIADLMGAGMLVQVVVFVAVTAVALAVTRPLVKKYTQAKSVPTNADRVLDQEVKVTEPIDNDSFTGAVYVDGKTWTARSVDGAVIPAGEMVRITKIEGVKLFVEKIKVMEEQT